MTYKGFCSAYYHVEHYTLRAFEQFGALLYAQPRWQESDPEWIRTQYLLSFEPRPNEPPVSAGIELDPGRL